MRISTTVFQNAFGKYLKSVINGDSVIITKNNRGVAKLIKYEDPIVTTVREGSGDYYISKYVTYEEYLEISEHSESRYELIDGQIYIMASPKHRHQVAIRELFGQMYNYFADKECSPLTAPFDVRLFNDSSSFEDDPNVVQPDILVICDEDQIDSEDNYHGVPSLVVEVLSLSSRSKDMIEKLKLYMKSGVNEYWIVDTDYEKVFVYIFEDREIKELRTFRFCESIESQCFEGLKVKTEKI